MKQQIADYEKMRLKDVEVFITELQTKADDLKEIQTQTRLYLIRSNPVDVVKTQDMKMSELKVALNDEIKVIQRRKCTFMSEVFFNFCLIQKKNPTNVLIFNTNYHSEWRNRIELAVNVAQKYKTNGIIILWIVRIRLTWSLCSSTPGHAFTLGVTNQGGITLNQSPSCRQNRSSYYCVCKCIMIVDLLAML